MSAYAEVLRQRPQLSSQVPFGFKICSKLLHGHQELGGYSIAPSLNRMVVPHTRINARERGFAEPDVSEFVDEREHLRRLAVSPVHEHQRSMTIRESEAAELPRAQRPMSVVPHDAADHHKHAQFLRMLAQPPQRHVGAGAGGSRRWGPVEHVAHPTGHILNGIVRVD